MRLHHRAAIAALTILAGCDTMGGLGNVSSHGQTAGTYRESDYASAGTNRDMWVIVTGAVPGSDAATLQQQTLAAMQRNAGINTRFTATPQNYNKEYKTVIVFNGPSTIQANELCRNPNPQVAATAAGDLGVQAVFCRADQFLTEVYVRARGGNSLSNPNFDALIRQAMTGMYAAKREEQPRDPGH